MGDTAEYAQVAAAAFTALAAGAAWRTTRQGQRVWRHSVEPDLHVQVLLNQRTSTTDMVIVNVGGGTAWGVSYALAVGNQRASGIADDGIMPPGSTVRVHASLPQSTDSACVIWWRTVDEGSWAIDRVGPKRRIRRPPRTRRARRRIKGLSLDDVWARFYPGQRLADLTEVPKDVRRDL